MASTSIDNTQNQNTVFNYNPQESTELTKNQNIRNKIVVALTFISTTIYLFWRLIFTLPIGFGVVSMTFGILLLFFEGLGLVESMIQYTNMFTKSEPKLPVIPEDSYPDVDVFIATYREPVDLLYKTINGCKHIEYPDKSKVHIHLCDDGNRPEARELAEKTGINYIIRSDNKGAKAGNLNNALTVTSAPLLLVLDADMIPKHDILLRMVPYFVDEEIKNRSRPEKEHVHIGFVQSPQSFYNPDLFQFNFFSESRIPNEQDYFFREVQVSHNASNSPIFAGSNTVISRQAIKDIGGFFTDSITEDLATGCLIQRAGYKSFAISAVLASGLSPTDFPSLVQQRIRWARGGIATGRKLKYLKCKGLTLRQRLNYLATVWYWYAPLKRLVFIMGPIMYLVFGYGVLKCTLPQILAFWLPTFVLNNITVSMLSRNIRNTRWTNIYETVLFPFMIIPVTLETFGVSLKKFKVTEKERISNTTGSEFIYMIPFMFFIVLSIIAIVNGLGMLLDSRIMPPIVAVFWLFSNLFSLGMALFFVAGRRVFRSSERVQAQIPCNLHLPGHEPVPCTTIDFSENGLSLYAQRPLFIDENDIVEAELFTNRYNAKVKVKIIIVGAYKKGWRYSFSIVDYCGNYDKYLCILYDRVPTLPSRLSGSQSMFDDLRTNITNRKKVNYFFNRQYPRIPVNRAVLTSEGEEIHVTDFNFKYALIKHEEPLTEIVLKPAEGLDLDLSFMMNTKNNMVLYKVNNYEDICYNQEKRVLLENWLNNAIEDLPRTSVFQPDMEDVLVREILGFLPSRDSVSHAEIKKIKQEEEADIQSGIPESTPFPWRFVFMPVMALLVIGMFWFFLNVSSLTTYEFEEEIPVVEQTIGDVLLPGNLAQYLLPQPAATLFIDGEIELLQTYTGEIEIPELVYYSLDERRMPFFESSETFLDYDSAMQQLMTISERLNNLSLSQTIRIDGHTTRMGYYFGELMLSYMRANVVANVIINNDVNRNLLPYEQRCGWGSYIPPGETELQPRIVISSPVINLSQDEFQFFPGFREYHYNVDAKATLDKTAVILKELISGNPGMAFRIEGPIEKTGNQEQELRLSSERARKIAEELIVRGVPADFLYTIGRSTGIPDYGSLHFEIKGVDIVPFAKAGD